MRQHRPLRLLILVPLLVMIAACGDDPAGTVEDMLAQFQEAAIPAAVNERLALFAPSAEANANFWEFMFDGGMAGDLRAPRSLSRPGAFAAVLEGSGLAAIPAGVRALRTETAVFPPEMYGYTFVYSPDHGWYPDETAEGAPTNGFRITWYAMTTMGQIAMPLTVRGHLDIRDLGPGDDFLLGFQAVRTQGGTMTVADFTVGIEETETGSSYSETISIAGTAGTGSQEIQFDMTATDTGNEDTGSYSGTSGVQLTATGFTFGATSSYTGSQSAFSADLDATLTVSGATTVLDLTAVGMGATGSVHHRNVKVADVTLSLQTGAVTASRPDGGALSTAQQNAVRDAVVSMLMAADVVTYYFLGVTF